MFGILLYFLIVVLIYASYGGGKIADLETALPLALLLTGGFALLNRFQFAALRRRADREPFSVLDARFHRLITRNLVLAVAIFTYEVHILRLPSFFTQYKIFNIFTTIPAVLFLGLGLVYLVIILTAAHGVYLKLYPTELSKSSYIWSNIAFSLPVLLTWVLLSLAIDVINLQPYEAPKTLISSPTGQMILLPVFLIIIVLFIPAVIRFFWGCIPLEPGFYRDRIGALCRRAGVKYADILYWPIFGGKMITAGVLGLIRPFRYILVTEALLAFLEPEEIDTVIAHEIGHVKQKHLFLYLFFLAGFSLVSYVGLHLFLYFIFATPWTYRLIAAAGIETESILSILISGFVVVFFLLYFRFVFGFFMRNFEREADIYVFRLFDTARPMISTFEKIVHSSGQPPDKPNWHHFSIAERVEYLHRCESDRRWIDRHRGKIKLGIAVYTAGLILLGIVAHSIYSGEAGEALNTRLLEQAIVSELKNHPQNAELYFLLGNLYHERKAYESAQTAYEQALNLRMDNPEVLNNLAWLHATSEDERYRRPEKAVYLAEKAVQMNRAAHILDTLAESYFVAGMYEKAMNAGREALKRAKERRSYYRAQLEKFTAAAKKSAGGASSIR
jgi:Zn-dependent protease with chaperone function